MPHLLSAASHGASNDARGVPENDDLGSSLQSLCGAAEPERRGKA